MRYKKSPLSFFISVCLLISVNTSAQLVYPETKQLNHSDNYFGTVVNDPYRWLENDTASDTKTWVKVQQEFTGKYLSQIPYREKIRDRFRQIMNYSRYYDGFKVGEYIIYKEADGKNNQPIYYLQKGLQGKPTVLIDPNTLSKDGTTSVELKGISNNKKYLAYSIKKAGSDWITIHVMDIATKTKLKDELNWVKFSDAAWCGDGFYYSRYDKPDKGTELSAKNQYNKVYYHKLGESQENDKLIYEDKANPNMYISPEVTEDERYLFITLSPGTDGSEVWYKDLTAGHPEFKLLFKGFHYNYYVVHNISDNILVYTNDSADNYRVIQVDLKNPGKEHWKNLIPEKQDKLEWASVIGGKLFCTYLKDASSQIIPYSLQGIEEKQVELPGIGTSDGMFGFSDDTCAFFDFNSYTFPPSLYYYNIKTGSVRTFKKSESAINTGDYTTKQVFYTSKDGTRIPMFIIHKNDIKLDGSHPTLLYAYGGFGISVTPKFNNAAYILLEQNGIYAVANIRGGGEYGEKWHKAGYLLNKQNVFDDFIAAAEYLIDNKYTTKNLLAINGGSNGGLLVGAVMTQRPDLFKVALPEVGVMDMLRFQKFTVGWGWTVEYGSSDSTRYFPYLLKYSPLHNIKKGVSYPATMVFTADHDDRVVPAHSFKFGAALQANQGGNNPVLMHIETNQGHGAGASLHQYINKQTDKWAFMFYNMGVQPKY
jgi:prolyl oligopeptidase